MKKMLIGIMLLAGTAHAAEWEMKTEEPSWDGRRDVTVQEKYDYNPIKRYRGEMESDGYTRMRNYEGQSLRGQIDDDGYGRLRDNQGNTYRVRPR